MENLDIDSDVSSTRLYTNKRGWEEPYSETRCDEISEVRRIFSTFFS